MNDWRENSESFARGVNAGLREAETLYSELHKERCRQGVAEAKKRGVRLGRPPKKRTKEFYVLKAKWEAKKISSRDAAKELGICSTTFLVWCHDSSPPPEMSVDEALETLRELKASLCNCTEMQEDVESTTRYLEAIDSIERYVTNKKRSPAKSQKPISQEVFAAVAENKSPANH